MANFWERPSDDLPQPELNPLTNPALERNLSRWAEVYFKNPPGKREQAIGKLLQDIKSETSDILIAEQARRTSGATPAESGNPVSSQTGSAKIGTVESRDATCPACRNSNSREHRFCSKCGANLNPAQFPSSNSSIFTSGRPALATAPAQSPNDLQWLRERASANDYHPEPAARQGWKYLFGGIVIVSALAGLAYLEWAPRDHAALLSTTVDRNAAPVSSASNRPSDEPARHSESQSPHRSRVEIPATLPASRASLPSLSNRPTGSNGIQAASQKSSLLALPNKVEPGDSGAADLRLAQRYLTGDPGSRNSSEAAKLLWKAVRKQNTKAEVLLSGLYLRGDGVDRSCDQARLLLVAASKSGAPQAAEQLRLLDSKGCR